MRFHNCNEREAFLRSFRRMRSTYQHHANLLPTKRLRLDVRSLLFSKTILQQMFVLLVE